MTARDAAAPGRLEQECRQAVGDADVIVVGPAPPLRGGIAAHTARLVEQLGQDGVSAAAVSYRRLYPSLLFPGRGQRTSAAAPDWSVELLDVLAPRSWLGLRRILAASRAKKVVLQWWHPAVAPALLGATRGLDPDRLVAVCHNVLPHEPLPAAAAAARRVLGRCGVVLCHSRTEAASVARLLGASAGRIVLAPLPCLLAAESFGDVASPSVPELAALGPGVRLVVAAGHLRPYKGTALLLAAWSVARRPREARLVVVGESYLKGRERREVEGLARADPTIVLVDRYVDDRELVRFLDSAEVLVAAHLATSQSGVIPIARALGLACIVSDAGELAEQAGGDGPDCRVVAAGDVGALAAALEARLAAPAVRATAARRADLRADFAGDWRRVIEAIGIAARP